MANLKNFAKSIALYTIVSFIPAMVRFFIFPIYVNKLSTNDYGILAFHGSVVAILTPVFSLAIEHSYARCFFDFSKTKRQITRYLSTVLTLTLLIETFFSVVYLLIAPFVFDNYIQGNDYTFTPFGIIALVNIFFTIPVGLIQLFLRNKNIPEGYFIISVSSIFLITLLELIAVFFIKPSAYYILLGRTAGIIIHSIITLIFIVYSYKLKPLFIINPYIKETIKYGLPIIPHIILTLLYFHLDKILVKNNLNSSLLGIYNVAFVIVNVGEMFLNALDSAMVPEVFNFWTKGNNKNVQRILNFIAWLINLVVIVGTIAGTIFIFIVTPKEYQLSYKLLLPLFSIVLIRTLFIVFAKPLFFFKRHQYLFSVNIFSIIGIVIGGYILLPYLELWGMVLTLIFARTLKVIITFVLYRINISHFNGFKLNWNFSKISLLISIIYLTASGIIIYLYNLEFEYILGLTIVNLILFILGNFRIFRGILAMIVKRKLSKEQIIAFFD